MAIPIPGQSLPGPGGSGVRSMEVLAFANQKGGVGKTTTAVNTGIILARSAMLAALPVADLTVEDPPIEEVIERVFSTGRDSDIPADATQPAEAVA